MSSGDKYGSTKAGALSYAEAGELTRSMIARAHAATVVETKGGFDHSRGLNPTELRTFYAVIERTVTYSKACDRTSTRELAAIAYGVKREAVKPWQRRRVSNALLVLAEAVGLIYETGLGHTARPLVGLPQGEHEETPSTSEGEQDCNEGEHVCTGRCASPCMKVSTYAATPSNGPSNTVKSSLPTANLERAKSLLDEAGRRCTTQPQRARVKGFNEDRVARFLAQYERPEQIPDSSFLGWIVDGSNTLTPYARAS